MKVGAVRQSILARILCFFCVCVCVCDSCVGLLCSSHAVLLFVVLLRCNHRTLQIRRVFSRFFSEYFPLAETGAVSCFSFSVQAAAGAIAARAHGLEAVLGGRRRRP